MLASHHASALADPPTAGGRREAWFQTTLGAIATFINGDRGENYPSPTEYVESGVPFVNTGHIEPNGRLSTASMQFITREAFDRLRGGKLQPGDIVYCLRGSTIGKTARVDLGEGAIASSLVILRANHNCSQDFLYYFLVGPLGQQLVQQHDNGSAQPNLSVRVVSQYPVLLPPLQEQRRIAAILSAFDDKIEINRRMNETLEAMARALFKSWFVDFDPVRAKAEGRAPAGMGAATAALFPNRLVRTAEGEVPEGWRIEPLDEVATFLNGLALQKFPPSGGASLPVIKISEMRSGITAKSDRASMDIPPKYVVNDGDVLFSWSGSLAVVVWTGGRGALNQHLFKVTSQRFPPWFFVGWLQQHLPTFQEIAAGKATTMGHIQRHHLSDAKVAVPPPPVLQAAQRTMGPLFERGILNSLQTRTLAHTRDALLPRLLSGELRVSDVDKVEAA